LRRFHAGMSEDDARHLNTVARPDARCRCMTKLQGRPGRHTCPPAGAQYRLTVGPAVGPLRRLALKLAFHLRFSSDGVRFILLPAASQVCRRRRGQRPHLSDLTSDFHGLVAVCYRADLGREGRRPSWSDAGYREVEILTRLQSPSDDARFSRFRPSHSWPSPNSPHCRPA
jgi:hypothetical protein